MRYITYTHYLIAKYVAGLCLTISEVVKIQLQLHGPDKLNEFVESTQHFMRLPQDKFKVPSYVGLTSTTHLCDDLTIHSQRYSVSSTTNSCTHICYVGETAIIKGKFDVNKAVQLNIPKGPLYGKLKNGEAITLPSGEIIQPSQVLGEAEPARYFAIVCDISGNVELLLENMKNDTLFSR